MSDETSSPDFVRAQRVGRSARGGGGGVPWLPDEDDMLRMWYGYANGAFVPYDVMADELNKRFHDGRPVRKRGAIVRREGHVLWGKPWGRRPTTKLCRPADGEAGPQRKESNGH